MVNPSLSSFFIIFITSSLLNYKSEGVAVGELPALADVNYPPYTEIDIHPEVTLDEPPMEGVKQLLLLKAQSHRKLDSEFKNNEIEEAFQELSSFPMRGQKWFRQIQERYTRGLLN